MMSWIEIANQGPTLIERMRALLRADNYISFVELDQLDGFRGDTALTLEDYPNVVVWPSVSPQAAEDLATLMAAGECRIGRASMLTYLVDGKVPKLPVAKRRMRYREPHWLPVMLLRP